jgi:hypothetical protein
MGLNMDLDMDGDMDLYITSFCEINKVRNPAESALVLLVEKLKTLHNH